MKTEIEVLDAVPVSSSRDLQEMPVAKLRRIPRHVLNYSLTIVVQDAPYPISDEHAEELGYFACVNQKTGIIENGHDRTRALVVIVPRGSFQCINLDDPDEKPIHTSYGSRRY